MIELIAKLYQIESELAAPSNEERLLASKTRSKAIIDQIQAWLLIHKPKVAPKSKLGEAIGYTLKF